MIKKFNEYSVNEAVNDNFDVEIKVKINTDTWDQIINAAKEIYPDGNYTQGLVTNRLVEDVIQEVVNENIGLNSNTLHEMLDLWINANGDTLEDLIRERTESYKNKFRNEN